MRFFKKWFSNDKEEPTSVRFDEIDIWLNGRLRLYTETKDSFESINSAVDELKKGIGYLENINYEPGTEPLIKTRVQNNLDSYIKHLKNFLNKVESFTSVEENNAKKYCDLIIFELNKFNNKSRRNFYIIQTFFGNKINKIVQDLKEIGVRISKLNSLILNDRYLMVSDIYAKINSIRYYYKINNAITNEKNNLEELQSGIEKDIVVINNEISNIKNSLEYREYENLESEKERLEENLEKIKNDVNNTFSGVERGLKKLYYLNHSAILGKYLETSLTLFDDAELEIIKYLRELESCIKTKKIDFSGKNEKILESISSITRAALILMVERYNEYVERLKNIRKTVMENKFINLLLDYDHKVKYHQYRLLQIKSSIDKLNNKINSNAIESLKIGLEKDIYALLSEKINIEI
ncbi:MAG: hypothetical protein AABW41_03275 [Nanoarchaeota archaeon]